MDLHFAIGAYNVQNIGLNFFRHKATLRASKRWLMYLKIPASGNSQIPYRDKWILRMTAFLIPCYGRFVKPISTAY
jgi:hypothetical protein